jgi:hypothetical protein
MFEMQRYDDCSKVAGKCICCEVSDVMSKCDSFSWGDHSIECSTDKLRASIVMAIIFTFASVVASMCTVCVVGLWCIDSVGTRLQQWEQATGAAVQAVPSNANERLKAEQLAAAAVPAVGGNSQQAKTNKVAPIFPGQPRFPGHERFRAPPNSAKNSLMVNRTSSFGSGADNSTGLTSGAVAEWHDRAVDATVENDIRFVGEIQSLGVEGAGAAGAAVVKNEAEEDGIDADRGAVEAEEVEEGGKADVGSGEGDEPQMKLMDLDDEKARSTKIARRNSSSGGKQRWHSTSFVHEPLPGTPKRETIAAPERGKAPPVPDALMLTEALMD